MYNKFIGVGRLTADPELRQTPNGVSVTSFSIAVDRPFVDKSGERAVDFLDIVAWRQTAEFICKNFAKGKPILVEGSIQTRQYTDKNGNSRRVWEIIADNVSFTESRQNNRPSVDIEPPSYAQGSIEDFSELDDDDLSFNKADYGG